MKRRTPTPEQLNALRAFAKRHGRNWKSQLNHLWMTGNYDYDTDDSMNLQQVRNQFGPSWLVRFKLPAETLESLELSNGEAATVEGLAHFLRFMKTESAPVPNSGDELDALLTRYMKALRRVQMEYVSELRVSRGQSPLPKRLLR